MARTQQAKRLDKTPLAPLPGAVVERYTKCGKANCRCASGGRLHGPYHHRMWREGGRLRCVYVRPRQLDAVRKACADWHREQRQARQQRAALEAFYMHEFREMRQQLRELYGEYGWKG